MATKKPQKVGGMVIKQDAGRLPFPIDKNGNVSICGKKKRLSPEDDVKRFRR